MHLCRTTRSAAFRSSFLATRSTFRRRLARQAYEPLSKQPPTSLRALEAAVHSSKPFPLSFPHHSLPPAPADPASSPTHKPLVSFFFTSSLTPHLGVPPLPNCPFHLPGGAPALPGPHRLHHGEGEQRQSAGGDSPDRGVHVQRRAPHGCAALEETIFAIHLTTATGRPPVMRAANGGSSAPHSPARSACADALSAGRGTIGLLLLALEIP